MTDYIPTTEEILEEWSIGSVDLAESKAQFDRWLEEHDRQVAEDAWHEGRSYGMYDARATNYVAFADRPNPYRKDET